MKKLKICILGNMNNNGFALLRYFRDLGLDAYLLLFQNDQSGNSSHFSIKADTWNYSKWEKYIKPIPAVNGYGQALSNRFINRLILSILYLFRKVFGSQNAIFTKPPRRKDIKELTFILKKYDVFIGSGATPAIFHSMNIQLDLFFPYSQGIEFLNEEYFSHYRKSKIPIVKYFANEMYKMQSRGISETKVSLTVNEELTNSAYGKISVKPKVSALPIVYPYEKPNKNLFTNNLKHILQLILKYDYILISHVRHQWVCPKAFSNKKWRLINKNNNWIIEAYEKFLIERPNSNSVLIFFEYGVDSQESKTLCDEKNISNNIIWLPKMLRKEILELIKNCSVGIGEFYQTESFWGSCGWEIFSKGVPLIHGYNKNIDNFKQEYGYAPPPILVANTIESILNHLIEMNDNPKLRKITGQNSQDWFRKYNGYEAAKNIINIF